MDRIVKKEAKKEVDEMIELVNTLNSREEGSFSIFMEGFRVGLKISQEKVKS